MKHVRPFWIIVTVSLWLIGDADANQNDAAFTASLDLMRGSAVSHIAIKNNRVNNTTVYGLYVRQLGFVNPGDTCDHATTVFASSNDVTIGAFVSPVTMVPKQQAPVGSNYLYNMLYQTLYQVQIRYPSSPATCALPGCTWGSDTNQYHWCIYLGALAPVSTSSGYTANIPPSVEPSATLNYNYNVATDYQTIGPITCNDQNLTCHTENTQIQTII